MDDEQFVVSSSPGSSSPSSSSRSLDSDIEATINDFVENGKTSSSSDYGDDEEVDGGFVSGGEEFEEEVVAPVEELDDSEARFVDSLGFSEPVAVPVSDSDDGVNDDDDDEEGGEGVVKLKESELLRDGSGEGLKILGVSGGSVEDVQIGTPRPVMVVKGLGENGGLGGFVKGIGVGDDASEGFDGVPVKVLEVPDSGSVESSVTESSNVTEKVENEGVSELGVVESSITENSNVPEKEEVSELGIVAENSNVPEKVEEKEIPELGVVDSSKTENSNVPENVEKEEVPENSNVPGKVEEKGIPELGVVESSMIENSNVPEKEEVPELGSVAENSNVPGKVEEKEIPELGVVESSTTENSNVSEKDEKKEFSELGTVESSLTDNSNVLEKVEDDVSVEEVKTDVLAGEQPAAGSELEVEGREIEEGGSLGSGIGEVEQVIVEQVDEKSTGDQPSTGLEVKEKEPEIEEAASLGSRIDEVEPVIEDPVNLKLAEQDVMEGDSVVGEEKESVVSTSVSVDNVFDGIKPDAEEPERIAKTNEVELNGSIGLETDAASVEKGNDEDTGAALNVPTKDVKDLEKKELDADENQSSGLIVEEKSISEVDPITGSDAKLSDLAMDTAGDEEKLVFGSKVDRDGKIDAIDEDERAKDGETDEQFDGMVMTPGYSEMISLINSVDRPEEDDDETDDPDEDEDGEIEDSFTDEEDESMMFESSEAAKQFLEELGQRSGAESSHDRIDGDGQIVTDSEEEADTDEEDEDGNELFDSAALAALLKAATGADSVDGDNITITSKDGSKLFSVERPAGLGSSLRPVKPPTWSNRSNPFAPSTLSTVGETEINLSDEEKQKLEKLQQIRVKFLRLVQRLGHSPEDQIAAQVLYRLALVAGRRTNDQFSLDAAKRTASQLEEENKDDLDFSLNILVLGKTGVGKSSTINSIFGEEKSQINAFEYATNAVKEINGTVGGVKIKVFDTPGLKSSVFEQGYNQKVLLSVKRLTKKCPPDIVLYVDRMDTQTRDLNDHPTLKTITSVLGSSIWRNTIVTLTHAASAPPDGPTGNPLSYEAFVSQRSHIVQQSIGQAVGDLRMMSPSSMNPVSLVENHPSCRKNREGLKVLPNGQTWKPQLLFLCYSMKILSEASSISKPQDPFDHGKLFGFRARAPPLPYLLSWLLQSRTHPKLLTDQAQNDVDSDVFDDEVDQEDEEDGEEEEYDDLPPFRPLTKEQLGKLSREQRNAYFEEYEYRVKLLQRKQWKEMKKRKVVTDDVGEGGDAEAEADNASDGMVQVPLPDMVLPHSFDGDNTSYRYRFLDPQSHLLTRPVLDSHGWDHDCGYDGVNIENRALTVKNQYPASVAVQITKDKKDFNIHLDSSISAKHGEKGSSMVGFDIQNVGKQLAYIVRAESKFKNLKRNKTTAGASVTFLGENIAAGVKVEDQLALGKRLVLIGSTGTVRSRSDAAYGANLEVQLREADYPIGQDQSSLGLSLVKWRGDLALGANLQSQVTVGRGSKVTVRAGLNNKRSGQISIAFNSTEQLQIALIGIVPLVRAIYKLLSPGVSSDNYGTY